MDLYASAALSSAGFALAKQRDALSKSAGRSPLNPKEQPSMQSIYQSDHWTQVRGEEYQRGSAMWNAAQNPWETGVVPRPAYASMFAAPDATTKEPVITTLAGTEVSTEEFKHNNMMPYFRGTARQNMDPDANASRLERFTGRGEFFQKKKEVECFFEPTAGYTNVCGMANQENFYLSHIEAPKARNNDFPIEQVRVGRGLGMGYTATPAGGFQQASTLDAIRPKNVDELRVATKPKISYEIPVQGPSKGITQRGMLGAFEKHRPDTYYEQSADMLLRTTGAVTKESGRPVIDFKPTARVDSHIEYKGAAKSTQPGKGDQDDYGKASITVFDNERQTTQTRTVVSNLTSMVKAIVAPLLDVVKRTPKEYTVDAARTFGNMQAQIPAKPTTYDPVNHVMRTTIKETTIHDTTILNPKGPEQGTVQVQDEAKKTVRETMPVEDVVRNVAAHTYRVTIYNADAAKKTVRETMKQSGSMYGFVGGPVNEAVGAYEHIDVQVPNTQKQFISDYEYEGGAQSKNDFRPRDRSAEQNAEIDATRETLELATGHVPNAGGAYESLPPDQVNLDPRKIIQDDMAARTTGNVTRVMQPSSLPTEACQITRPSGPLLNGQEERLDPSLLTSLKSNPYNLTINPI